MSLSLSLSLSCLLSSLPQGPLDLLYDNAIKDILSLCADLTSTPKMIGLVVKLCTTRGAQAIREAGGMAG